MAWDTTMRLKGLNRLIRNKREMWWIGQSKMAKLLDVSQSTYNKIETGVIGLSAERLVLVCDRLQITPEEAFKAIRESQGGNAENE